MSEEIELKDFENRVSTHPNRRKLTIISQSPNEMIVDIERADNLDTENGTKRTAYCIVYIIKNTINNIMPCKD